MTTSTQEDELSQLAKDIWRYNTYALDEPEMKEFIEAIEALIQQKQLEARLDELELLQGQGERGGHDTYCRTIGEALLDRLKNYRVAQLSTPPKKEEV